jgi:4-hydroxy-tetrahydrodipicolinate synthase
MSNPDFRMHGLYTALVTPFTAADGLDEAALRALIRRQIAGGVDGLVPCGTTGEAVTLSPAEYERVIAITVEEARGAARKITVLAGAGASDTREAVARAKRAESLGADALLVVTPAYNKPSQAGLLAHFRAVADAVAAPIVLYNVPGRTGVNLAPETTLTLAQDRRFAAIKEASGHLEQAMAILRDRPASFSFLSGEDALTLPLLALGADGAVAVVSNEAPDEYAALLAAARAGDWARAREFHYRLLPLMQANFLESNPGPVKYALARLGGMENRLRLPLVPLSARHHATLDAALHTAGLLDAAAIARAS